MKHGRPIIRICLVASVLLAGCQLWQTNQPAAGQLAEPPKPDITWMEKAAAAIPLSSCWHYANEGVCTDTAAPPEIVGEKKPKPLSVLPGATLTVTFPHPPIEKTLRVTQWLGSEQIEQLLKNGNQWKAPQQPGWYLFDVRAEWEQGDAGYAFAVEVREPRL